MKIFLSSTAYDLFDLRAIAVDRIRAAGHIALHHEMPTFPNRRGLHAHDMCIHAIDDADAVLCVIDKRYGGTYAGNFKASFPSQTFPIRGYLRNGASKVIDCTVTTDQLSITWCELIRGYGLGKQVVTFARARTLDEKMTRRRNQYLTNFKPAYADRNEIFDLLDWITKRPVDNWIVPFNSAIDFDEKLQVWLREIDSYGATPGGSAPLPPSPSCGPSSPTSGPGVLPVTVVVEGPMDRTVIAAIASSLSLPARVDVVPAYGKVNMLRNIPMWMHSFQASGAVVFLADADTYSNEAIEATKREFAERAPGMVGSPSAHLCLAVPQLEAWLWQAIDPVGYSARQGVEQGSTWRQGLDIARAVEALSLNADRVANVLPDFASFLNTLRIAANQAVERSGTQRNDVAQVE